MKKRIRFQFENKTYTVEVEKHGNEITFDKDGEIYRVTLLPEEEPEAGRQPEAATRPASRPKQAQSHAPAPLPGTASPQPAAPSVQGPAGPGAVLAPMSGVIKDLKVSDGQKVEKGQVVMVMEAMKMDIDVPAPESGTVTEISVRQGDNVKTNQKLMSIR